MRAVINPVFKNLILENMGEECVLTTLDLGGNFAATGPSQLFFCPENLAAAAVQNPIRAHGV